MAGPTPTKVVTGVVRLSYVNIFEPYANDPEDDPKYSCVILIPKGDKKTLGKIDAAIKAAAEAAKNTKFEGKIPSNLATTLHDGDEEGDLDRNPEYAGHMYMSVSARQKPGVVDANVQPILDSTEVYSGCYARVEIGAFAYNYKGKKGVSFGLNHVQKIKDGESLTGRTKAEDAFDAWDGDEDEDGLI
jgi:hypothetical protein